MLNPDELAEIEALIFQKMQNPAIMDPKIEQLEKDPSCYNRHQFLLENSMNGPTILYSSKHLFNLLNQDCPLWNIELLTGILNWIPILLQNKIELLFSLNRQYRVIIIDNLAKLFSYILSKLWEPNSRLSHFFGMISTSMPDSDLVHRALRYSFFNTVINEIKDNPATQKIQMKVAADRMDTCLFDLFSEVVNSIFPQQYNFADPQQSEVVLFALQLLFSILRFYRKKSPNQSNYSNDGVTAHYCDLPICFRDIITNENFLMTLFSFFGFYKENMNNVEIAENTLRIVLEVVSIKKSYFQNEQLIFIIDIILRNSIQLMQMNMIGNGSVFLLLSQVTYRLSDYFLGQIDFEKFSGTLELFVNTLCNVLAPYLSDCNLFINNNPAIVNMMNFWPRVKQFRQAVIPLFQSYIQILIKSSVEFPDQIIEVLDLEKYIVCEAIRVIPKILEADFASIGPPLASISQNTFEHYKSLILNKRDDPNFRIQFVSCDIQMTIFVLIMTSGLRNIVTLDHQTNFKKRKFNDYEVEFINFIFAVIGFTDQNIQSIFSMNSTLLERAIYVFALSFRRTAFAQFDDSPDGEGNEETLANYNRLLKRLVDALYNLHIFPQNDQLIYQNLLAINNIYEFLDDPKFTSIAKPGGGFAILLDVSREITEAVASGAFQFVSNPEICYQFKKEISMLMTIVRNIVTKTPENLKPFLLSLENKFNELAAGGQSTAAVLVFIYELIGIFSSNKKYNYQVEFDLDFTEKKTLKVNSAASTPDDSFIELFDWVFPDKLEILAKVAPQISTNPIVCATYLKCWYVFISQVSIYQREKSIFKQHSPNAIIIFSLISNALVSYFQAAIAIQDNPTDNVYQDKLKPLKNAMLLMSESLGADYIMFGAFELYNDQTLVNLLTNFINLVEKIPNDKFFQYPKLASAFIKLIDALCKNHLMTIIQISLPFFDYLFRAIIEGLTQADDKAVTAVECGTNIGDFLQSNKTLPVIAESIVRNQQSITQILGIAFDLLFSGKVNEYKLITLISHFLTLIPDYLPNLMTSMMPQVPQENAEEYQSIFQELIKTVYVFERFKAIMNHLSQFAKRFYLKVPL